MHVSLVLNLHTLLISSQFHIKYDSTCDVMKQDNSKSQWQTKTGFTSLELNERLNTLTQNKEFIIAIPMNNTDTLCKMKQNQNYPL